MKPQLFKALNPIMQLLALISVITYLIFSLRILKTYELNLRENFSNTEKYQYRWLRRLLIGFGMLWLCWIPFTAIDYFYYHYSLDLLTYFPLYLTMSIEIIWLSIEAFLRPEVVILELQPKLNTAKLPPTAETIALGDWLKMQVESNLFYNNTELSLRSLAEELQMHPNELSRVLNDGLGKNFSDFVNGYRVDEVIRKMHDPAYEHITLLGIAFDSGFNSKTTFNRTLKAFTGKSPVTYKNERKIATVL